MYLKKLIRRVLRYAEIWDRRYLDLTVHAIRNFKSESEAEGLIEEFLSSTAWDEFNMANPFAKKMLLGELLPALLCHLKDETDEGIRVSCAMGTFLRKEWNFPEGNIEFDIGKAKKVVRNALAGFDFIGRFEAVTYQNEFCELDGIKAPLVCWHCHCIIWTTASYSKLERLRRSLKYRFGGELGDKTGPHFAQINDLEGAANAFSYTSKMQVLGKRTAKSPKGSKVQTSRILSYRSYDAMFDELRKHDLRTFWLSGGEGAEILRQARYRLLKQSKNRSHRNRRRRKPKYRLE